MLGHRSTYLPRGGTPSSTCRIKSGKLGHSLVNFHASDPTLHALPLPDTGSRHESLRIGSRVLEEHVRQLSDTRNELSDNSGESFVRLERLRDLLNQFILT